MNAKDFLSKLMLVEGKTYYSCKINNFVIKIYTHRIQEHPELNEYNSKDSILNHNVVDVYLFESSKEIPIDLEKDKRFKNYAPIKYSQWVGLSSGVEMPLEKLFELINYLDKL